MIVVSDTTAISNLLQIGEIEILEQLYGKIILPQTVYEELLVLEERGFKITTLLDQGTFDVIEITRGKLFFQLSEELDLGEAEAIVLAVEKQADMLLIDEL